MKRIYIVGVNGTGLDILDVVCQIRLQNSAFPEVGGFLDDRVEVGTTVGGVKVLGPLTHAQKLKDAWFVSAIGSPQSYLNRPSIVEKISNDPEKWMNVIHPSAVVSSSAQIGKGVVILSHCSIGSGVRLGNYITILQNSVISHDTRISDFAALATGVCLSGSVSVGKNVYLGSGVCVRGDISIGHSSLVGMGAVVTKNVPANQVWCGNPACFLKEC